MKVFLSCLTVLNGLKGKKYYLYSEYHYKNKDGKKHSNDLTKWSTLGKRKTSPHYDAIFPTPVSALLLEISREKSFCWFYKYSRRFRGKQKGAFYSKPPHEFNDSNVFYCLFSFSMNFPDQLDKVACQSKCYFSLFYYIA